MNLVFIVHALGIFGGGRYSVYKFAKYLAKRGHKVTVFLLGKSFFSGYEDQAIKNFKIILIPLINLKIKGVGIINKIIKTIFFFPKLNNHLKKNNVDFIFGYQINSAIEAFNVGRKYQIKVANFVFETPEWLIREHKNWQECNKKNRYLKRWNIFEKVLLKSDLVFPNSKITKQKTEEWLKIKINDPIYPGIDKKEINMHKKTEKKNQIIYIGKLNPHKSINFVIEALSNMKNHPLFVICGNGSELNKLKKQSKELNVTCDFKGNITDYEKWKLLNESLFMVFPSSFEGFGMPPMEALAAGIPCICSDIPILKSVYGNYVEYFTAGNVNELTEKIKYLYQNPEYGKRIGNIGKKFILKNFTWDIAAQNIEFSLNALR